MLPAKRTTPGAWAAMSAIASNRERRFAGKARTIGAGLFLAGLLSACATDQADHMSRRVTADAYAYAAGFDKINFPHLSLPIVGFQKGEPSQRIVIVVEGDGASWDSRRRVSANPTPRQFVGLKIASSIKNAQVIYLGRPCQYVTVAELKSCSTSHWSERRFSIEVMDRYSEVIEALIAEYPADRIEIAGYSGGGVIAAVQAARIKEITRLTTIAAPLDTEAWVSHHGVSPLDDPVDGMSHLSDLCPIQQTHFYGGADNIVPLASSEAFKIKMRNCQDTRFVLAVGKDHGCCWTTHGSELVQHWISSRHER